MATSENNFKDIPSQEMKESSVSETDTKLNEKKQSLPDDETVMQKKDILKEKSFKQCEDNEKKIDQNVGDIADIINKFLDTNSNDLGMKITIQPLTEEDIEEVIKDGEGELNIFDHLALIEKQNDTIIAQNNVIKHMLRDIAGSMKTCNTCTDGDTEEAGESDAPDLMTRLFNIENQLKELSQTMLVTETQNTHILRGMKKVVYPETTTLKAKYITPLKVELTKRQFNELVDEMKHQRKKCVRQIESHVITRIKTSVYNAITNALYVDQVKRVIPIAVRETLDKLKIKYK